MPQLSRLVASPADDRPLSPSEAAEMKAHLAFLRSHKAVLRLQLNAAEDLLVNGQREPSDRGLCRHLLAKFDRSTVEAALAREPFRSDATARIGFLAGAVRITGDVGVLISYLEALAATTARDAAALAFQDVVERIDFTALSPARLVRLMQVFLDVFTGTLRTRALFGLLSSPAFAAALETAQPAMPSDVLASIKPLSALLRASSTRQASGLGDEVAAGMRQLLALSDELVKGLPERLRIGVLEIAFAPGQPPDVADRAAAVLLPTLPAQGRDYSRLAMRQASSFLRRHEDAAARPLLQGVAAAHQDFKMPSRWLEALESPRVGRIAVQKSPPEKLCAGFWLDAQREVWVRTSPASDVDRLAREAELQRHLALPGVARVATHGADAAFAFVALSASGRPLMGPLRDVGAAFAVVCAVGRVLRALSLAGVRLPDASMRRWLAVLQPAVMVTLVDMDGAERTDAADCAHAELLWAFAREVVPDSAMQSLVRPAVTGDLVAIVELFDAQAP